MGNASEFVDGQCTGHGFGSGIESVKDLVKYEVLCQNPRCVQKIEPTDNFDNAQFRAQWHARQNKDHPTMIRTTETYRDGHKHVFLANSDEATKSVGEPTGYVASKKEQNDARKGRRNG